MNTDWQNLIKQSNIICYGQCMKGELGTTIACARSFKTGQKSLENDQHKHKLCQTLLKAPTLPSTRLKQEIFLTTMYSKIIWKQIIRFSSDWQLRHSSKLRQARRKLGENEINVMMQFRGWYEEMIDEMIENRIRCTKGEIHIS